MEPFHIRPYDKYDADACVQCFQSNIPTFFTELETKDYRRWLNEVWNAVSGTPPDEALSYYVILSHDQVVGCGGFAIDKEKKQVVFAWGLVHNRHHKKGFGKALSLYRINIIEGEYPDFDIVLDTTQHTYGFFERLGFRTELITPDFYAKGLDRYDMRRPASCKSSI
ncbi:GNAT family N-acetyltransferase [Flavitalea sp.]|nr:GNAT family N-acetyltransferase [Flavitalea sp.]